MWSNACRLLEPWKLTWKIPPSRAPVEPLRTGEQRDREQARRGQAGEYQRDAASPLQADRGEHEARAAATCSRPVPRRASPR